MSLEAIIMVIVGVSVPAGALIFFEWVARKETRDSKPRFGRFH